MSVLRVKNGNQWDIVPAIKGDTGDPAAPESITDDMLVTDGIKTEIEWLWGNQLTDSREGDILQTDDAYEAPLVSLDVDGKSTQATTTGKNLFDKNTAYSGQYINSSGISASGSSNSRTGFIPITGGNSYAFSYGAALSAGNYIAWYTDANESTVTGNRVDARGLTNIVATAPSDAQYVRFSFQTSSLNKVQLEAGSSATAYEPYTGGKPAPSPDYPQEIASLEPELILVKKNLFPITDGSISGTGNSVRNAFNAATSQLAFVEDSQYTVSMDVSATSTTGYFRLQYLYLDGTTTLSGWFSSSTTEMHLTSTAGKSIKSLSLANYNNNAQIELSNIQIELGSTATDYEPYLGNTASLLPDGYSLRSLPDGTKDELRLSYLRPSKREGWAWYSRELVKRVDTHTFNGSETWSGGTIEAYNGATGTNRFNAQIADLRKALQVPMRDCLLSDVLMHTSTNIWSTPDNYIWYTVANDNQIHIVFDNAAIGVTSETAQAERTTAIRAWLAENPITLQYPLATPTTETLDPIELPIMPSRTVNVWSDPATNLKMTYIQDTNLVIESLEATVADMVTS